MSANREVANTLRDLLVSLASGAKIASALGTIRIVRPSGRGARTILVVEVDGEDGDPITYDVELVARMR